jgi:hypothetical protein
MASKGIPTDSLTFEALTKIGGLDQTDEVRTAIDGVRLALQREEAARVALDELQQTASANVRASDRRDARAQHQACRREIEDAACGLDDARMALNRARAAAYSRVAPTLQAAYDERRPKLVSDLKRALESAKAVLEVASLAASYMLPAGASVAPGRTPVASQPAEMICFELGRCLAALAPVLETPAA